MGTGWSGAGMAESATSTTGCPQVRRSSAIRPLDRPRWLVPGSPDRAHEEAAVRSREMTERPGPQRRGLVMVSDPDLLDTLLRLAAAAGCELQRAVDPAQARAFWSEAPLVLLDAAGAAQCARAGLPRRGDVVLAVRG